METSIDKRTALLVDDSNPTYEVWKLDMKIKEWRLMKTLQSYL